MGHTTRQAPALSVLYVCTANMCRSPAAATLLQAKLAGGPWRELTVSSAGVSALDGWQPCPALGITDADHRSRAATGEMTAQAGLILVAERDHRAELARRDPAGRGRTFTIREAARISDYLQADAIPAYVAGLSAQPPVGLTARWAWFVEALNEYRSDAPPPPPVTTAQPRSRWGLRRRPAAAGEPRDDDPTAWERYASELAAAGPDDIPDPHLYGERLHPAVRAMLLRATESIGRALADLASGLRNTSAS
ncbi:MAG: hypothetical protein ACOYEV_03585 [Candidatus Nanopelagicales bacterium]